MRKGTTKRQNISMIIIAMYLASVLLVSIYPQRSWEALLLGLSLASAGSVATYLLLRQWESRLSKRFRGVKRGSSPAEIVTSPTPVGKVEELENTLVASQDKHKVLILDLNQTKDALHKLKKEHERFEERTTDLQQELDSYKTNSEEELRRKTVLLSEYQETINQQRDVIKKRQEAVTELETKVEDLNYEVKTLLQLAEMGNTSSGEGVLLHEEPHPYHASSEPQGKTLPMGPHSPQRPLETASAQLKRCVDIAQKITRSNHFGNGTPRFRDMPIDNHALNLRRLCDNLRCENSCAVLVYSQKEKKLLFANDLTKHLLGWTPEQFTQNFPDIIQEGAEEWVQALNELSATSPSRVRLLLRTREGQNLLIHCHLGPIPTGVFRNHVVGVMVPA